MQKEDYDFIEAQIGYDFKNRDLLQQAFVRRSYSKENGGGDNEVLEFIGDKVLDFIVVKLLVEEYGYFSSECDGFSESEDYDEFMSEYQENKLTEIKKTLTEKKTLAKRMDALNLAKYLIMGKGDVKNNIQTSESVKEDLFEAILGAVALDCHWDLDVLQDCVGFMLNPEEVLNTDDINYIAEIQEWSLKVHGKLPKIYRAEERFNGFYTLYNPYTTMSKFEFGKMVSWEKPNGEYSNVCELFIEGVQNGFGGRGVSKRQAVKDACRRAYDYLEKNGMLWTIADEIENPSRDMAINQLEILSRRGYFSIPTYEFFEEHDENGNPVWKCECHIEEEEYYFDYTSSSKKDAKKGAAYDMLLYVLDMEDEDDE